MPVKFPKRKRFALNGYSAPQMMTAATAVRDSVKHRILRAQDVSDHAAPPLKRPMRDILSRRNVITVGGERLYQLPGKQYAGYPGQKQKAGAAPIRDWKLTGDLMKAMQVLTHRRNHAVIGFSDDLSNLKAFINNRRWRQFGVSPRDRAAMLAVFAFFKNPVSTKAA